jgi:hypothetical protein
MGVDEGGRHLQSQRSPSPGFLAGPHIRDPPNRKTHQSAITGEKIPYIRFNRKELMGDRLMGLISIEQMQLEASF